MASPTPKKNSRTKQGSKSSKSRALGSTKPSFNMDELREIADLIDERGFTDFEFENEKIRVRMSKNAVSAFPQPLQTVATPTTETRLPVQDATKSSDSIASDVEMERDDGLYKIASPIVGTFYSAPAPDKDAYVKEGDMVSEDTTVCIVEAMKLMNEIQAEISGKVEKIYVENGQPVEFGQPLFGIKQ